jgi:hypothetical protein
MNNLSLLYIDPGTGSALFSILFGAGAALYFALRALILKLKVLIYGKNVKNADVYPCVIYCESRQYYNVFKPVLEEFEKRKTEILYLTSALDDPVFERTWQFIKAEFIGEGNRAFARLNILKAKICLMTTPGLGVYQLKRSKMTSHYSHVLHMASDATMYRLFGIDYFDSILLTGDYQADDIRVLERQRDLLPKKQITVGCGYLDEYAEKMKTIPIEENKLFTVLVSPSWGPSALLSMYGERLIDPLVRTGWRIIIRPHPQSIKSENAMLEKLNLKYGQNVIWDYDRENIYSLVKADIMISDFSGILFDFIFLCDKPVLYANHNIDLSPFDAGDLDHEIWQFKVIKELGIELFENDFKNIGEIIKTAQNRISLSTVREKVRETAWQYRGEAGKRIYEFMMDVSNDP